LKNIEALDAYYKTKIRLKLDNLDIRDTKENLKLNKKLHSKIEEVLQNGIHQLDFIVLFYISFFDLSIDFKKYLESEKIEIEISDVLKNCKNLLKNPVIIKSGVFAFLELLDKLFVKLNLDSKKVKIMDVQNINNLHNINDVLDSLEGEIIEK
jgi:glutaredoxin-related protein